MLEILAHVVYIAIAVGVGASGYRYMLKRDPVKLEKWAAEAKAAGDKLEGRFSRETQPAPAAVVSPLVPPASTTSTIYGTTNAPDVGIKPVPRDGGSV